MKKILLILGVLFAVQLAVIYAFKIPQGPKGEAGLIGPAGPQGPQGILGSVGSATIRGMFDITAYGAKGDGVTDDTQAIQAAIDAAVRAKGTIYIPASPVGDFHYYRIAKTITIVASPAYPADQIWIAMIGQGHIDKQIVYDGPSNEPAFKIIGLKGGYIQNVKIHIANGKTNVTAWELGTSDYAGSTGGFSFYNCTATLGNGANNRGWRLGYVRGGASDSGDISNITFDNCTVWGAGRDGSGTLQAGFVIDGGNTLQLTWTGGGVSMCHKQVHIRKGGSAYFFGFGGSHNAYDFYMEWANNLGIWGGRYEVGKKFLYVAGSDNHHAVKIDNVQLGAYSPPDGIVFQMDSPGTLQMGAVTVNDFMLTGPVVRLGYNGVNVGNFQWTGGYVQGTMTELVSIQSLPNWKVSIKSVGKMNAAFQVPTYFADR